MEEKKQLEALFRISRALVGKQNLDEVLFQIVTVTADLINSKICSLMLHDEGNDRLVLKATQSLSPSYRNKPAVKVERSISGSVMQKKEPVQVRDVTLDDLYSHGPIARKEGVKSLLSVPMLVGEKAIGVLNCYTKDENVFTDTEIKLVQTIANQAAISIEHTRIVVKEEEARLALETRNIVEQAKRFLIKKRGLSEEDAHRLIQKMSMQKGKPIKEIANAIMLASEFDLNDLTEQRSS